MAKRTPKGKKKSSNKSEALTTLLIIQAFLQIIKIAYEIIKELTD
jgi:hypothetical protein